MAKKKHEYESEEFLKRIEGYAKKGYTDKEIAYELDLNPNYFSDLKAEKHCISEALARGRAKINNIVRQRFLAVGLGGLKTKRISKRKSEAGDDETIIFEEENELAPNPQVLSTWLFNHDEEWRKQVIEGKKLDVTTNGKEINNNPLVFVSASELKPEDLDGLIKAQIGGGEVNADSSNDTGS